jgi:hypothetical protein
MRTLNIAVAQFQPKDGEKEYNLSVIEKLTAKAKDDGAEVVSFHELCITAYTHLKDLSKPELDDLSEEIPKGESTEELIRLSKKYDIPILAGLVEKDDDRYYNSYICVDESGVLGKHRKIHPFISEYLSSGKDYTVFEMGDWTCGILICYDNNVIENVRATTLLGAEVIFAPHVTMCTPSSMPGRGYVDDELWQNRHLDPVPLPPLLRHLPDGLERVTTPPYEIGEGACDPPETERDPLYLCANMAAEPSLSFTQAATTGSVLGDEGLELTEEDTDQLYATLLTEADDRERLGPESSGEAAALIRDADFEEQAVLVVQTGWGSGSFLPHVERVEETESGVHAFGCHRQPCVYTDDYTARTAVVRFERPAELSTGVVSLTVAPDERWNAAAGEGIVDIPSDG